MTDVEYTAYLPVNSTAVDDLYFNENDNTLTVDWDDSLYRFSGVTRAEAEAVQAGTYGSLGSYDTSVGRAAQRLKTNKGPGEYIGDYGEIYFEKVDVKQAVGVPKDFTTAQNVTPTKEYSLGGAVSSTTTAPATKEYSLQPLDKNGLDDDTDVADVTVFFTLEGSERLHEFEAESADVYDAVEELNEFISRLRTKGRVVKVVVEFA